VLTSSRELAGYFEDTVSRLRSEPKLCATWVMGEVAGHLNRDGLEIDQSPVTSGALAGLLRRIADGTISGKIAKDVFEAMWAGEGGADAIIDAKGLRQISDSGELERIVDQIMAANPGQLADYRAGRDKLFAFFVGQVMKQTQGKANPAQVNEILRRKLLP
jgi:aspartyl-tRNA(Asn)/glutamyl-tRNA(Gln) amidotransferase subunit B